MNSASSPPSKAVQQLQVTAARGAGWAIVLGLGARVLSLVGSIVITHWLDPEVMGEVGVAIIVLTTFAVFSTIGYGHYMLAKHDEGPSTIWHITVLHIGLGVVAYGLMALFAEPVAAWMNAPVFPKYVPWILVMGMCDRFQFVPERILIRAMQMKRVAMYRSAGELSYIVSALALVFLGYGGFAVILANVVRSLFKLILFAAAAPPREWLTPHKLSLAKYKEILTFGAPLALGSAVYFGASRWDNLIVSMLYGPALMGQYNVAYNLAAVPADQIGESAEEALLPSLSRVKKEERPNVLLYSVGMLSFIIFPISIGLGLVATTAARTFIGKSWDQVGAMMAILCVLSIARPMSHQVHAYMLANGRPRIGLVFEIGKLAAVVGFLFTIGRVSAYWACVAVGLAYLGHAFCALVLASREGSFPLTRIFARLAPPFLACLPMVGAVLVVRWVMSDLHLRGIDLAAEIVAGAIGYVAGAFIVARKQMTDLLTLVKQRGKNRGSVAPEQAGGAA